MQNRRCETVLYLVSEGEGAWRTTTADRFARCRNVYDFFLLRLDFTDAAAAIDDCAT